MISGLVQKLIFQLHFNNSETVQKFLDPLYFEIFGPIQILKFLTEINIYGTAQICTSIQPEMLLLNADLNIFYCKYTSGQVQI